MTAEHPDTDTLADYAEELLAPETAAELEAHVSDCADCTATLAALAELSDLLAEEPAPPLPEDIATRIDEALAQESIRARGDLRRTRQRRVRRVLSRTAIGLAAAAVIGLTGQALLNSGGESAKSSAASGAANRGAAATTAQVFTRSGLAAQAQALVARFSSATVSTHPQAASGSQKEFGPADLPACALAAAGHKGAVPLAGAYGLFEGHPVYAVVYAGAHDSLDVVLVRAGCGGTPPGATAGTSAGQAGGGDVLLQETVPRH